MFWVKIGVNRKTLLTIEGVNKTPSRENCDYEVTVTKERDKSKYSFWVRHFQRNTGLILLVMNTVWELINEIREGEIPKLDDYMESNTKWDGKAPAVIVKGKR